MDESGKRRARASGARKNDESLGNTRSAGDPSGSRRSKARSSGNRQPAAVASAAARAPWLERLVELEVIPRLVTRHRSAPSDDTAPVANPVRFAQADIDEFVVHLLADDEGAALAEAQALRARGVPVEDVMLGLMAPAARALGRMWEEDKCNFTEVTVGVGRLQRALRELTPATPWCGEQAGRGPRILLLPAPGEQHAFGLSIVAGFFRRACWDVVGGGWTPGADAPALAAAEWFDVAGFSLGAEIGMQALTDTISEVRRVSRNPGLIILVGGVVFDGHPERVAQVGADVMAQDPTTAPRLAERLIVARISGGVLSE